MATQKYVLVKFLEDMDEGAEFIADNYWPLHITLVANFTIPFSAEKLYEILASTLKDQQAIRVTAGEDELFGANKDIRVTAMKMTPELVRLHKNLVSLLQKEGAIYDEPKYLSDGYRAHATVQTKKRLDAGDEALIDEVTIVDMFPDHDIRKRKVLKTIRLT